MTKQQLILPFFQQGTAGACQSRIKRAQTSHRHCIDGLDGLFHRYREGSMLGQELAISSR
jgi:hypothetical protein